VVPNYKIFKKILCAYHSPSNFGFFVFPDDAPQFLQQIEPINMFSASTTSSSSAAAARNHQTRMRKLPKVERANRSAKFLPYDKIEQRKEKNRISAEQHRMGQKARMGFLKSRVGKLSNCCFIVH
jgi:hypothetical protein